MAQTYRTSVLLFGALVALLVAFVTQNAAEDSEEGMLMMTAASIGMYIRTMTHKELFVSHLQDGYVSMGAPTISPLPDLKLLRNKMKKRFKAWRTGFQQFATPKNLETAIQDCQSGNEDLLCTAPFIQNNTYLYYVPPESSRCSKNAQVLQDISLENQDPALIVVLDRSQSLSPDQLSAGRRLALQILDASSSRQRVALVTLDDHDDVSVVPKCLTHLTTFSLREIKQHLSNIHRFSKAFGSNQVVKSAVHEMRRLLTQRKPTHTAVVVISNQDYQSEFTKGLVGLANVELQYLNFDSKQELACHVANYAPDVGAIKFIPYENHVAVAYVLQSGLLAVNVKIEDFFAEVVDFESSERQRLFVIDKQTTKISYHPSLNAEMKGVNIRTLEPGISEDIVDYVLTQNHGSMEVNSTNVKWFEPKMSIYWQTIENFVLIEIKLEKNSLTLKSLERPKLMRLQEPRSVEFYHHRLDLDPPNSMCRHFLFPATLESGSIYLTPYAFKKPHRHFEGDSKLEVENVSDILRQFQQHGKSDSFEIQSQIKQEIRMISSRMTHVWKNTSYSSILNNYIVRRYVATKKGVLFSYPGTPIFKKGPGRYYDPRKEEFYKTAAMFPGRIVLTAPVLDDGGAGHVVTASQSVHFQDLPTKDNSVAVAAMDLTLGFLRKILLEVVPVCNGGIRCFLFDHRGYLIVHPSMFEPKKFNGFERKHITHLEPQISSDLLGSSSTDFVIKKQCKKFDTIQNFYEFSTTFRGVVVNQDPWMCARYKLIPMPGTNLFLGMVNDTACGNSEKLAFCPCDTQGRKCILCSGFDSSSCECPCECNLQQCQTPPEMPACEDFEKPELNQKIIHQFYSKNPGYFKSLPPCFETVCSDKSDIRSCLGVMGCSWCHFAQDSTPLEEPFCSGQNQCFGGVLGQSNPIKDPQKIQQNFVKDKSVFAMPASVSVAPIAASILGAFLVLLSVYCYKARTSNWACFESGDVVERSRIVGSNREELNLKIGSNFEEEEGEEDDQPGVEVRLPHVVISPYRMNPGYRPPPGAESSDDHGYSTMTPMSEVPNPHRKKLESELSGSRASSPMNATASDASVPHQSKMTTNAELNKIGRNQIVVAATVHRTIDQ